MRFSAGLVLLALAVAARGEELPPAVRAALEKDIAACRAAGGEPAVGARYATAAELNGDAAADWVLDPAGLDCAGAGALFCFEAGCPISIWLSGTGGHLAAWRGHVRSWRIEAGAVVVERERAACAGNEPVCSERLVFGAAEGGEAPAPPEGPAPPEARDPPAAPEPDAPPLPDGWTLRAVPGRTPVAIGGGAGDIRSLAVFCLAGRPWLAATLQPAPAGERVEIGFAFTSGSVGVETQREDSAGGAYVAGLTGTRLAAGLAGRDPAVRASIAGADQGTLSLEGSTRAVRGALESCHAF